MCTVSKRAVPQHTSHKSYTVQTHLAQDILYIFHTTTITISNINMIYTFDLSHLRLGFNEMKMQAQQEPQAQKFECDISFILKTSGWHLRS